MAVLSNTMMQGTAAISDEESYQISKSVRFNAVDNPYFTAAVSVNGNQRCWTWSGWVKFGSVIVNKQQFLWDAWTDSSNYAFFDCDDKLRFKAVTGGSTKAEVVCTRELRDPSAWYHLVIAVDTCATDAVDRIRIFVNGHLETEFDTATYPAQDTQLLLNSSGIDTKTGRRSSSSADLLFADVYHIDGLSLSCAAFGKFDSLGIWQPKAFTKPTPNDGTTWSNLVSGTEQGSGYEKTRAFNGTLSNNRSVPGDESWNTFTPSKPIPCSTLRVHFGYKEVGGKAFKINGVQTDHFLEDGISSNVGWIDYSGKITSLESIAWYCGASGAEESSVGAIEVDGVRLIDGQTDASWDDWRELNQSAHIWSSMTTGTGFDSGVSGPFQAFKGYINAYSACSGDSEALTFIPKETITASSQIRIYAKVNGSNTDIFKLNNSSIFNTAKTALGDGGTGWFTTGVTAIDSTHGLYWERNSGSEQAQVYAIEVDGVLLTDGNQNSFHYKLEEESVLRYLAKDSFGTPLDDATGGIPIYNTTDVDGHVKGSGFRTDSSAGTTDGTGLVVAIPGDATTSSLASGGDIHASINTGSSNITFDTPHWINSTANRSRFYGKAMYFNSGLDMQTTTSNADLTMGTGDFTVELWVMPMNKQNKGMFQISSTSGGFEGSYSDAGDTIALGFTTTSLRWYGADTVADLAYDFQGNVWYHIAYVRASGTSYVYVNGQLLGSRADTYNYNGTYLALGAYVSTDYQLYGYVNDFRIYKGVAKYTSSFKTANRNDGWTSGAKIIEDGVITGSPSTSNGALIVRGANNGDSNFYFTGSSASSCTYWYGDGTSWTYQNSGTGTTIDGYKWIAIGGGGTASRSANIYHSSGAMYTWTDSTAFNVTSNMTYDATGLTYTTMPADAPQNDTSVDTPTSYSPATGNDNAGGVTRGNYCTFNPLSTAGTLSEGNLKLVGSGGYDTAVGTIGANSGKWYAEFLISGEYNYVGIANASHVIDNERVGNKANAFGFLYMDHGSAYTSEIYNNTNSIALGADVSTDLGDATGVAMVAMDIDAKKIWWGFNGTWFANGSGTGNPATGANPHISSHANFTDGYWTWAGSPHNGDSEYQILNAGQRAFKYAAPSGFKTLCSTNLEDIFSGEQLNDPSYYFDARPIISNDTNDRRLYGYKFGPDLVWCKSRGTASHKLYDKVRGVNHALYTDLSNAPNTNSNQLSAWRDDGYDVGTGENTQYSSGVKGVHWAWDVGTAASGANTNGSINVADGDQWVNNTSGISITKYEGTGANATVGHGLSTPPEMIIIKGDGDLHWPVYIKDRGATHYWLFDVFNLATDSDTYWQDTAPTNTVFSIGSSVFLNQDGTDFMAYCFTSIPGYSAVGSYTGTGVDPNFVYLGFSPKYLLIKGDIQGENWICWDTARTPHNQTRTIIRTNANTAEATASEPFDKDLLSNGFATRSTSTVTNTSGTKFYYLAFAEHPFKIARAQ